MNEISTDLFEHTTPPAMMPISSDSTPTACQTATPIPETVSAMEPRFRKSMSARHRIRRSIPGAMQNQRPSSPESQNGTTDHAEPIRAETWSNPSQEPQKLDNKPEVIRICLDETQAAVISAILDRHQAKTKICGVLCAVTRSFRPAAGIVTVELQILEVDRRTVNAVRKLLRA
jgi:hypothetical protein